MELYAPIKKEKTAEYLKGYYAENKEDYITLKQRRRETPEGREKYNAYMRELKKKRRKTQKEQS